MKVSKDELKGMIESVLNESADDDLDSVKKELEYELKKLFAEAWDQGLSSEDIADTSRRALIRIEMMHIRGEAPFFG